MLIYRPEPTKRFRLKEPAASVTDATDTTRTVPRIRIKLDANFGKTLLDTSNLGNLSTRLKGIVIKAENTTNCMLNFNFGQSSGTGIRVYYRKSASDVGSISFLLPTNAVHFANFKNEGYKSTTTPVYKSINNAKESGNLMYVQSMAGTTSKLEIPYLKNLGKVVINKAELELTVVTDSKTELFPPIDQLILRTAQFSAIQDVVYDANYNAGTVVRPLEKMSTSGGFVRTEIANGTTLYKYYFNLSTHLQQILEGKQGSILTIIPHFKEEKGSRVVLYGPKSKNYRAKINVYYTVPEK